MINKKGVITSISQITIVNLFSMFVTAFLTLVVPRCVNQTDYGLWQLFVFYQGYLGFFHFGWNDGIYLRYGGYEYSKLDKKSMFSQFWTMLIVEGGLGLCFTLGAPLIIGHTIEHKYIAWQLGINLVILNSRYMLIYLLQTTSRIKEYSVVLGVDRFMYFIGIVILLLCKKFGFEDLIWVETISKTLAYIVAIYYCKDFIFQKITKIYVDLFEIFENVRVGSKLLFSNIASILIMGICRVGIEKNWGIEIFGEVSLTITLSQLFITFITNIGMVLFPLLKRIDSTKMAQLYNTLDGLVTSAIMFVLVWYYPASLILERWIPAYTTSIMYMGILLPICFYESKMALLNSTYLKALREERTLLRVNICTMILSLMLTFSTSFVLKNLELAIASITIVLAVRSIWSGWEIDKIIHTGKRHILNFENVGMIVFIIANYFISGWKGFVIYAIISLLVIGMNLVRYSKLKTAEN